MDYRDNVPVTRHNTAGQCHTLSPLLQSPHRGTSTNNEAQRRPFPLLDEVISLVIIMLVTNLPSFPCEFLLLDTQPLQNMVRLKFMRSCFVLLHRLKGGKIICSRKTWLAGSGYKCCPVWAAAHCSLDLDMETCYKLILALLLLCSLHQDTLVSAKPAMDQVGWLRFFA